MIDAVRKVKREEGAVLQGLIIWKTSLKRYMNRCLQETEGKSRERAFQAAVKQVTPKDRVLSQVMGHVQLQYLFEIRMFCW